MLNKLRPKSDFSRNVLTLMTGTTIAQAIPIAVSPILTRIYTPEDFGLFALYIGISSVIGVIATGRYEMAIMLPKKDTDALNIVALSIIITFFISFFSLIVLYVFNSHITHIINNKDIQDWLYFIPFSVLLTGLYQSLYFWLNRNKKYKNISTVKVAQSASVSTINISMGVSKYTGGLIIGSIFGQLVAFLLLLKFTIKNDTLLLSQITRVRIIAVFNRYISFLKFGVIALFTSSLAGQSLFFLVSIYLDVTVVGFISLIQRLISIPSALLGNSLGNVFYQEISQVKKERSYTLILNFTKKLFFYSFIFYFLLYIFLNNYFIVIFGESWSGAVEYIKYLLIVGMFSFIFSPLSMLFNYFEIQNYNFLWQSAWLLSNIGIFVLYASYNISIETLFIIYTVKQVILYMIGISGFLFYARRITNVI